MFGIIILLDNLGLSHDKLGYDSNLLIKTQSSRNNIFYPNSLMSHRDDGVSVCIS